MKINTPKQIYNKSKWETLKNDFNFRVNADMNFVYGKGLSSGGSPIWSVISDGVNIYHNVSNNNLWWKTSIKKNGQDFDISQFPIVSMAYGSLSTNVITQPVVIGISDGTYYYISNNSSIGFPYNQLNANIRTAIPGVNTLSGNQIIWDDTKFCLFGNGFIETCSKFDQFSDNQTSAKFELVENAPEWNFEKGIFANGLYVAYINNNKLFESSNVQGFSVSSDLETWSDIVSVAEINTTNGTKIYLAYSDGKYIAVTSDGVKAESVDGQNWSVNDEYIQSVNNVVALPDLTLSILAGTNDDKTIQYKAKGDDYFAEKVFNWQSSDSSQAINPAYMTFDTELNKLVLASVGANGILTKSV